ncbi:hypothetical protein HDV05_004578 [Chytridiales sp. JEL 0842]|nr:hypothetical protein HDV05_004578 [Chytridiales sp. JEL 0842]
MKARSVTFSALSSYLTQIKKGLPFIVLLALLNSVLLYFHLNTTPNKNNNIPSPPPPSNNNQDWNWRTNSDAFSVESQYSTPAPPLKSKVDFTLNADKPLDGSFIDNLIPFYKTLYTAYKDEIVELRKVIGEWCHEKPLEGEMTKEKLEMRRGWRHMCISGDLELEMGYLRLRYSRPKVVW